MVTDQNPPAVLILRARDGSDAALGELLELYRSYLHLLAEMQISRRLRTKVDASDVVQEAFLRVQAGFADFVGNSEGELVVWLRRILARALADQVRRFDRTAKRSPTMERSLHHDLDKSSHCLQQAIPSPSSSPSQRASRREEAVLVADAIGLLPSHYRQVILLRSFQQRTFPEVAEQMRRSVTSVKKLWTRALEQLQQELSGL